MIRINFVINSRPQSQSDTRKWSNSSSSNHSGSFWSQFNLQNLAKLTPSARMPLHVFENVAPVPELERQKNARVKLNRIVIETNYLEKIVRDSGNDTKSGKTDKPIEAKS